MGGCPIRIGLWAVLVSLACAAQGAPEAVAARVNGASITTDKWDRAFDAYLQQTRINVQSIQDPKQYKLLKQQVLEQLISQELLWQEAQRKKIVVSADEVERMRQQIMKSLPSEEAFRDRLRQSGFTEKTYLQDLKRRLSSARLVQEDIAKNVKVTDQEIHDYYAKNAEQFKRPEQVRARHILVQVAQNADAATKQAARKRVDQILAKAKSGADFAGLAKQFSDGPTAPNGGDLGYFPRGRMVAEFEKVAFSVKPGQISEVVETSYGYHILKVEERRAAGTVPESEAKEQIRQYLSNLKIQQAIQQRLQQLRKQAKVEMVGK